MEQLLYLNFRIRRVWVVEPPFTLIKFRSRYSTQSSRSPKSKNHPKVVRSGTELNQLSSHHLLGVLFLTTKHQE